MRYDIKGKKLPSVTEIIGDCTDKSGALTYWAAGAACQYIREHSTIDAENERFIVSEYVLGKARLNFRDVSQEALDVGLEVHDAVEMFLKGKDREIIIDGLGGQAANGFGAFLEWNEKAQLKPIGIEETVYSDSWAGTLDFYGECFGKLYVIDWKSSKAIYPEYRYQVAAYRSCKPDAVGCALLRLDKTTGEPEFRDYTKKYEEDLAVFNCMVDLYYARHPIIRKQVRG